MLKAAIDIANLSIRLLFSDRQQVLVSFLLMPMLFIFLIGQAIGDDSTNSPTILAVKVVNEDTGNLGALLVQRLEIEPTLSIEQTNFEAATMAVENEEAIAAIVIPAGFSDNLFESVTLDFFVDSNVLLQSQLIQETVLAAIGEIGSSLRTTQLSTQIGERMGVFDLEGETREEYANQALELSQEAWRNPQVTIETQAETPIDIPENRTPTGNNQSSPGMTVMFAMFLMLGGGATLVVEREQGTLRRLLVMPIDKASIILGKMLGIFVAGVIQIAVLILAGNFLFDVQWGLSPLALALVVISFALSVTGLSIMVAALVRTSSQVGALTTLLVLSMAALGGAWWPLEIVPSWLQTVARLTPVAWAMEGFHDIVTRGFGVTEVLPEVGVLLIFAIVFTLIGIIRFRYE